MPGTLSARYVWRLLAAAAAEGAPIADLAGKLGLHEEPNEDFGRRIASEVYLDLWLELVRRTDDGLPLRAAKRFEPDFVVGFACMTAPTLRGALLGFTRWVELLADVLSWRLDESTETTTLSYTRGNADHPGVACADEHNLALIAATGRRFVGEDWPAHEVRFVHTARDPKRLRAFFGGPVRFGCADVALSISADVLRRQPILSHPEMAVYFERQLEQVRASHQPSRDPTQLVDRLLRAELGSGPPTLARVAGRLGTSERTLRRALARGGTTFERLLDGVRSDVATQLVAHTNLRFEEIALLAGFSDPTALYRAFRRWTGETPRSYRASRHPGAGSDQST